MKIAIVDDERYWRDKVYEYIAKKYSSKEVEIYTFENPEKYLGSSEKFEISFVDIEMPNMDGFTTITEARKNNEEAIYIILSTHTEMSRKGYMVNAFRYIDKVKIDEELEEAISAAEILLGRNEKISINIVNEGEREIVLKNIIYIETEKRSVLIHTKAGTFRCNDTLLEFEEKLEGKWFYRCHNVYIVNLDEIVSYKDNIIYLSNGADVDISKRKMREFKKAYLKRQFECANG